MNPPTDPATPTGILFTVSEVGTLMMAGVVEPTTRAQCYEDAFRHWDRSPQDLLDAMEACNPLEWIVNTLYAEIREELECAIDAAEGGAPLDCGALANLKARLASMPEDDVRMWLSTMDSAEVDMRRLVQIRHWFASPPDWVEELEYIPAELTGQGAALQYFQHLDPELLDRLGVSIVEGEHPGSTYIAAELDRDVNDANRIAAENGIPLRFVYRSD
jgi:hypothetical protein